MSDKVRETSGSDQIAAAEWPSSRLARPCEGTPPGWNSTKNCRRRIPVSPKKGVVMPVVAGAELNICDVAGAKLNICDVTPLAPTEYGAVRTAIASTPSVSSEDPDGWSL